ncbi:hypothetical protein BDQ17DRAFT_948738 [Cyathus striatus]|nr:hypothetical protein BDQ17DRAFT_948738 [Cyathus striatus]
MRKPKATYMVHALASLCTRGTQLPGVLLKLTGSNLSPFVKLSTSPLLTCRPTLTVTLPRTHLLPQPMHSLSRTFPLLPYVQSSSGPNHTHSTHPRLYLRLYPTHMHALPPLLRHFPCPLLYPLANILFKPMITSSTHLVSLLTAFISLVLPFLTSASIHWDAFGTVQRDIPNILEAFTRFLA